MLVFPHGTPAIKTVLKNMQKTLESALKVKKKRYIHC